MKKRISIMALIAMYILIHVVSIQVGASEEYRKVIYTNNLKSNKELEEYSGKFLKDTYNLSLDIPVEFKKLDDNILGLFHFNTEALKIEINTMMLEDKENYCEHDIERTLRHELTHYVVYNYHTGHNDGDVLFEIENYKNGGRSNNPDIQANFLDSKLDITCCE